jgi:putative ABC transport system permease protein
MTTSFDEKTNMILLSDLSFRMKDNARTFLTAGLKNNNPYTFSYTAVDQKEQNVAFVNETIREENMKANNEQTMLRYYKIGQDSILIARESDFNRFAKMLGEDTIDIQNGHVKVVKFIGNELEQTKNLLTEQSTDPNETNYSTDCPPLEGDNMTKLMPEITYFKDYYKRKYPFSLKSFFI